MSFKLDSRLDQDGIFVRDLKLSQLRIMNHQNFPWLILVSKKDDLIELTDLNDQEYMVLTQEIRTVSLMMQTLFKPDKLNIATIGNVVSQLHIHIIARYRDDKLFPKPVWGGAFIPYEEETLTSLLSSLNSQSL